MAYRGEDLDLRTPQGWGPAGREVGTEQPNWWTRSTTYHGGRADPIWVDDTVMACCNHAYDLAVAHRAGEVRLEHLLNALTLNSSASQALEARGIRDAALRRESSAIIAAEIPAAQVSSASGPKRSPELEEALRMSAERAYPRRTPVTVDDLLSVLFEMKRDIPGIQLLYKHVQWSRNGAEPRPGVRLEPLPHLARNYGNEPRFDPRPGYGSHDYHQASNGSAHSYARPERPQTRDYDIGGSSVDSIQNNRIEALERAVRDLGLDLADDRKSLQSIVTDLQRNTMAQTDDTLRFRSGLTDRLGALEQAVMTFRDEPSQLPGSMLDRMAALERNLDARLGEMAHSIQASSSMIDRLTSIERSLDARLNELGRAWAGIGDHLSAIEAAARRPGASQGLSAAAIQRLEALSDFDDKLNGFAGLTHKVADLESTFQLILDRMVGLERHLESGSGSGPAEFDLQHVEARLEEIALNVAGQLGDSEGMTKISERLTGIERAIENRTAETGRTVSFIGERLRAFDEAIGTQRTHTTERLAHLETLVGTYADQVSEAGTGHSRDLSELHEAIVKLNNNQQTLANSLEQWRLDNTGDLSVVSNRLKSLEEADTRREPIYEALAGQLAAVHNVVAKREEHKSKFRQWLFGTDEWFSASYDTERWRARQLASDASTKGVEYHDRGRTVPPPAPVRR